MQVGIGCRGAEKNTDKKRSRMSPWRLAKKILEQVFGVGLGPALSLGKLCPAVPHARELQPPQGAWYPLGHAGAGTLPAPCRQCHSGKFRSTAKTPPSGCLREKGQYHCLFYRRRNREDIGAASKFRADPQGFLTCRHFSWEHTIPHMLLMFSPQRARIFHLRA